MPGDIMQPQHIPAWKKLGLKLKVAKDSGNGGHVSAVDRSDGRLQDSQASIPDTEELRAHAAKKRRLADPRQVNGSSPRILTSSFRGRDSALKKKVAFTAETKDADGDSCRVLLAAQEARDQYIEDLYNEHSEQIQADTKARSDAKGHGAGQKESKSPDQRPRKSRDALDYLNQFHDVKDTWKFNKNREVWILKHALSPEAIPKSYNQALAAYVGGLRSNGARLRLTQRCKEIVTQITGTADATGDDHDQHQALHEKADVQHLERPVHNLDDEEEIPKEDSSRHNENRQQIMLARARLLLHNMGACAQHFDRGASASEGKISQLSAQEPDLTKQRGVNRGPNTTRKKRKNRTLIADLASSEDDSDSDESEVKQEPARKPGDLTISQKPCTHLFASGDPEDNTSSSGESSDRGSLGVATAKRDGQASTISKTSGERKG